MSPSQASPLPSPALDDARQGGGARLLLLVAGALTAIVAAVVALVGGSLLFAAALAIAGIASAMAGVNVPIRPRRPDEAAARALMTAAGRPTLDRPRGFEAEVDLAYSIQEIVFAVSPFEKRDSEGRRRPIPAGQTRELSDFVAAETAHCFDRSRAIETLLRLHGLKVRHVSVFTRRGRESTLRTLLRREALSHSLTEVKTECGWMAVDSNFRFVAVSAAGEVFDMPKLAQLPEVEWDERTRQLPPKITRPFVFVYGLYSRHGQFYPPFVRFPNVNWRELVYNFWR